MQTVSLVKKFSLASAGAAVLVVGSAAAGLSASFTEKYEFNNVTPVANRLTTTESGVGASSVQFGSFGSSGVNGAWNNGGPTNGRYRSENWTTNNFRDPNQYFEFTVDPVGAGTKMIFTSFFFDSNRNPGAPQNWVLAASVGGGSFFDVLTNQALTTVLSGSISGNSTQVNQGGVIQDNRLVDVTQQVKFRLYGFNSAGTNNNVWFVDNVTITGAVPTPAALPAILGFGVSLWRKRKEQTA